MVQCGGSANADVKMDGQDQLVVRLMNHEIKLNKFVVVVVGVFKNIFLISIIFILFFLFFN